MPDFAVLGTVILWSDWHLCVDEIELNVGYTT